MLTVGALLAMWWKKRMQLGPEDDEGEDETEFGHQALIGALEGGVTLLFLAVMFLIASRTALADIFYGRDCQAHLTAIQILETAQAHEQIVKRVEERLQHKASADCCRQLIEKKLQAMLKWTEQLQRPERISKLEQVQQEAQQSEHTDLAELARVKIQIAREQQRFEELKKKFEQTPWGWKADLPDIFFQVGQAELTAASREEIAEIAKILNQAAAGERILIWGHTDATGQAEANLKLSEARAMRTRDSLEAAGVSRERMTVQGFGSRCPIASNDMPEGRKENRRVEIILPNNTAKSMRCS
jgi:outer membrane protein OmpA-like peptidoglycan-associated protein